MVEFGQDVVHWLAGYGSGSPLLDVLDGDASNQHIVGVSSTMHWMPLDGKALSSSIRSNR